MNLRPHHLVSAVPVCVSLVLVLSACGSGPSGSTTAAQAPVGASTTSTAAEAGDAAPSKPADRQSAPAAQDLADSALRDARVPRNNLAGDARPSTSVALKGGRSTASTELGGRRSPTRKQSARSAGTDSAADQQIYDQKQGATDIGITKESIKLGSINMHGMPVGKYIIGPMVRGNLATVAAINDRGGILGRRVSIVDCDDGAGEVSRSKSCVKKLVVQEKIFALIGGATWSTAALHDDLKQYQLPHVGSWGYSQTEWQDPFMFPTHMSMIHEAMAGANWARNVVKPKTYGLVCLTSPEMQLACSEVRKIMDASGATLVRKADIPISETTMASYVLGMRTAAPEHIIHYVINPLTIAKFIIEGQQQGYYPPKGISGNHLAAEIVGSVFGKWAAGRYWTNTTYKLWGAEFMATMRKYAKANRGANHHVVQTGYMGIQMFAAAAKQVGVNLTRERLVAALSNGTVWKSDASLDQRFQYTSSERQGNDWNKHYAQGREFMYRYADENTASSPDGSPNGWELDPDQGVIYTWR